LYGKYQINKKMAPNLKKVPDHADLFVDVVQLAPHPVGEGEGGPGHLLQYKKQL
jgi:hypothetical protein